MLRNPLKQAFYKYHGAGNDFIMIDNRDGHFDKTNLQLVRFLCHRHFGVGSDGLILLENHPELDFTMVFYNPDGSQSFCGNGSRCAIAFAKRLGMIENTCTFLSTDGVHEGVYLSDEEIHLKIHDVGNVEVGEDYLLINTGSPHYIQFVADLEAVDVVSEGKKIRYNERFKQEGVNVNFVQRLDDTSIAIRTYERGVENETLACGTGIVAAALASHLKYATSIHINVKARGGDLFVKFDAKTNNHFTNVWLVGPAVFVFTGDGFGV
jgi:diaminopimelate epimerase